MALAVGSVPLALSIAWGRAGLFGGPPPVAPRYVHLAAALLLPAVAVGLTELGRDRRPVLGLAIALLLVGVPGNVAEIEPEPAPFFDPVSEELVLTVASQAESEPGRAVAAAAEHRVRPHHRRLARDGRREGRIPDPPDDTSPELEARGPRPRRPADRRHRRPDVHRRAGRAIEVEAGDRLRVQAPSIRVVREAPRWPAASTACSHLATSCSSRSTAARSPCASTRRLLSNAAADRGHDGPLPDGDGEYWPS